MTDLAALAVGLEQRVPVRRFELSRSGEVLAEVTSGGEPRWLVLRESGEEALDPREDAELPLSGHLDELRRTHGAVVVAWRPARRMVVKLRRDATASAFAWVKAFRNGRMPQALERHVAGAAAARAAGLITADVLAVDPACACFTLIDLGAGSVPITSASAARFHLLGEALATFQSVEGGPALIEHDRRAELEVLEHLARSASRIRARLPDGWEDAHGLVADSLAKLDDSRRVRAHRDLHDKQLLLGARGVALLDFDLLCVADEALDPANLLAHLELRVWQGLATEVGAAACAAAFRSGFAREGDGWDRRLAAWRGAAFLRLALIYQLRPPHAHLATRLVERARHLARGV